MLKAVIFDMDGVIIDSEPQHARAAVLALEKYNVTIQIDYAYQFIGTTTYAMCQKMIDDFHLDITAEELWRVNEECKDYLTETEGYQVVPYVTQLIKNLHQNHKKLIIASSSSAPAIEHVMKSLQLVNYFDSYISGMNMPRPKPAPDIFLAAARQLGVEPSECIVIEDSFHGVTAAAAAGITSVGYINPNSGAQDLSKAAILVESFEEVDSSFLQRVYQRAHLEPMTIVETEHCIVEEIAEKDFDDLYEIYSKPEISPFLQDFSGDKGLEREKLLSYIKQVYPMYGYGLWGIYTKDEHQLIGQCGIEYRMLGQEEIYELGYLLDPAYQGLGYAAEAVSASIAYCFRELDIPALVAIIDKNNIRSIKLAEKVGLTRCSEYQRNKRSCYRYEMKREREA